MYRLYLSRRNKTQSLESYPFIQGRYILNLSHLMKDTGNDYPALMDFRSRYPSSPLC